METRKFESLQAYMEGTGTSARALLARLKAETGHVLSDAMFSYILRGSRRCSRYHAVALHHVTGVPMDALTKWPKSSGTDNASGRRQNSAA